MTATLVTLAILMAGAAGTAVVLALRMSGLKADAKDADTKRANAERELETAARELETARDRHAAQLSSIRLDLEGLEHDLESCECRGTRRDRLERLLSKAANRSG